ncbi:MAG: family 78 glycoside hydrolase catalytic domain [Phycisphaerae bacterium]|nr:family 78 glycoside hydrolase catalytic domain [Phycisphaerae bacterium]
MLKRTAGALSFLLLFLAGGLALAEEAGGITAGGLTCEYAVNPLAIDVAQPRFGWLLKSDKRGQMQSAYQVLVASSAEKLKANVGDKWDSGKIASARSVNVVYAGKALAGRERCWWKVRVFDKPGRPSPWSKPAKFEMGLLKKAEWTGEWIGLSGGSSYGYVDGKLKQALVLNGAGQSVRVAHYAKLKPAGAITIAAWIKPGRTSDSWQEIYRKEDGAARCLLAIGKSAGKFGLWCGLGIGGAYVERGAAMDRSKLVDGKWHLVVANYDGKAIGLYADGKEIGSSKAAGALGTSGKAAAYIGSSGGSSEFFKGGIDDVRIYARALSGDEIEAMALAGGDGKTTVSGLVGWWKLDGNLDNSVGGNASRNGKASGGGPALAPLLRKTFKIAGKPERARAYISTLGWGELYINGRKVGDSVLDPATSDYHKRTLYATRDVTEYLRAGDNAVGVMLGNGWYCEPGRMKYGASPRVLMQMHIELPGGAAVVIKTDDTWKGASGPIVANNIWGGETYDARLEKPGWAASGYDDSGWKPAEAREAPRGKLQSQIMGAIRVRGTIEPVKFTNPKKGVWVYDMGQLFGGWARLRVKGPKGAKIAIKYAARMFENTGLVDKRRHRGDRETDYYTLKGDPAGEVYEPRFTYHPVRYVQIEGHPGKPAKGDLDGRVVYSAVDMSGDFECSNPMLNRIHRNVVWTMTNGLFGIPLDCLHREHWAWTDPATITGCLYTRKHMPMFWTKWLDDIADAQYENGAVPDVAPSYAFNRSDPAWGGNYPILVWYLHEYYDDKRIVERHYAGMKKWIDHLTSIAEGHLIKKGHYGDHMLPGSAPGAEQFISRETPRPLVWTGYYYRGALVLSKAARLLGKSDDAKRYAALAGKIAEAFNTEWFKKDANQYATGSQTANVFPLSLRIVPEGYQSGVLNSLVRTITEKHKGHLHTGNTGTTCLIDTLPRRGQGELMYRVATVETYPGWGYMVKQGATTIWEMWGLAGGAESMIMWATIDEFLYRDLAGISAPEYYGPGDTIPGFREVHIRPQVLGGLKYARASITTVRGRISSSWKIDGDSLGLEVGLPAGSAGKVSVPVTGNRKPVITESGKTIWKSGAYVAGIAGITAAGRDGDYITFEVGSGAYSFKLTPASKRQTAKKP